MEVSSGLRRLAGPARMPGRTSKGLCAPGEAKELSPGESSFPTERARQQSRSKTWSPLLALPWILPLLLSLYLKHFLMTNAGGFYIAARSLGREEGFGFWERLSFFQMDVVVGLAVAIVLVILSKFWPSRWWILFIGVLSAAVTLAVYVQFRAFRAVGEFLSFQMIVTAIRWGLHEPAAYVPYLGIAGILILSTMGASVAAVSWLLSRRHRPVRRFHQGSVTLTDACAFCLLPIFLVCLLPKLPATPYHSSILLRALSAYGREDEVETRPFAGLSTPLLLSRYREFTHAPVPKRYPAYWAKESGNNVLFFVLETTPARFLPSDGEMYDLPHLAYLREKSFVAVQHYTTFPRTHEAVFSLLSSWYPSDVTLAFEQQHPELKVPALMRTLSAQGYYTGIYSPMRHSDPMDEEMFQELGVQHQIYPPGALLPSETRSDLRIKWGKTRIARDIATLELMKQDMRKCLAEGHNFAGVFLPQISHLPYPPQLPQDGDLRERARMVLKIEDAWLGELLQLLRQQHQLDRTVIVIVGDHGIRTSLEDRRFQSGMIDEYSFHVPLLIYSPRALEQPLVIPWLTSHIDVAPTVLDLLGVEQGREFEEGTPIWNAGIAKRRTYFLAQSTFGADGYYGDGHFYMRNLMSDSVYVSSTPHFQTSDIVSKNSVEYNEVSRSLARMAGLQQVAATHFSRALEARKDIRNHIFDAIGSGD
jgi:hypothetical protein